MPVTELPIVYHVLHRLKFVPLPTSWVTTYYRQEEVHDLGPMLDPLPLRSQAAALELARRRAAASDYAEAFVVAAPHEGRVTWAVYQFVRVAAQDYPRVHSGAIPAYELVEDDRPWGERDDALRYARNRCETAGYEIGFLVRPAVLSKAEYRQRLWRHRRAA